MNSSLRFGLFHKVIFVLLFLIPVDFAFGQEKGPIIHFAQKEHDFGVLSRRECARYSFCFRNLGTEPLIISDVRTSCGCTSPKWTAKPVMPNEKGLITVEFRAATIGPFRKTVAVYCNASNSSYVLLYIKGSVVDAGKRQKVSSPALRSRRQGTRLRTPLCMAGRQRVGREYPGGRHGGAAHGIPIRRYAQPLTPSPRDGTVYLLEPDPYGSDGGILPHASTAFQRGLSRGGRLRRGDIVHGRVLL